MNLIRWDPVKERKRRSYAKAIEAGCQASKSDNARAGRESFKQCRHAPDNDGDDGNHDEYRGKPKKFHNTLSEEHFISESGGLSLVGPFSRRSFL